MSSQQNESLLFLTTRDNQQVENYNAYFSLRLPRYSLLKGFELSLQTVEFPNTVYPINQYNNDIIFQENGGGNVQAFLTPGDYTGPEFAIEIQTQLNAAGTSVYTVTYDDVHTKKLTISANLANTIGFKDTIYGAYEEMGFDPDLFVVANTITSDYPINISGSAYVDLVSNIAARNYSTSSTANVIARIPLYVPFGNIVFYEPQSDDPLFVSYQQLDEIYLSLRDDKGNPFELPRNAHLSIMFKVLEVRGQ
jgi:hypothetical protein